MSGIPAATSDILDATIPEEFAEAKKLSDPIRFKYYRQELSMDPVMWERYEPPTWAYALSWSEFKYEAIARAAQLDREIKSDLPGLYIFYIRPTNPLNGFPKLPLYIGISNERDSRRPLRDRLKDYLPARVATKKKRQNIDRMLRQYYGVLWVTYCLIDKASVDLSALETKLHGFMHPTVGRRDFPVEVKTQQKAFGKI